MRGLNGFVSTSNSSSTKFWNLLLNIVLVILAAKKVSCIIGGDDAQEGQFTYQVSLQHENVHMCGGGIIDDSFILTNAHCVVDDDGFFIRKLLTAVIGTVNLKNPSKSVIKILVEKIFVPKEYKPQDERPSKPTHRSEGDIAILKLKYPIELTSHPHLTKLRLPSRPFRETYEGAKTTITGFGINELKTVIDPVTHKQREVGQFFGNMRSAKARVLSNKECSEIMYQDIHRSNLCARVEQRDDSSPEGVCYGDSGSPLVRHTDVVIGVLSSSPNGCTEVDGAGVYTRITSHVYFIKKALEEKQTSEMRLAIWYIYDEVCPDIQPILVEIQE